MLSKEDAKAVAEIAETSEKLLAETARLKDSLAEASPVEAPPGRLHETLREIDDARVSVHGAERNLNVIRRLMGVISVNAVWMAGRLGKRGGPDVPR